MLLTVTIGKKEGRGDDDDDRGKSGGKDDLMEGDVSMDGIYGDDAVKGGRGRGRGSSGYSDRDGDGERLRTFDAEGDVDSGSGSDDDNGEGTERL